MPASVSIRWRSPTMKDYCSSRILVYIDVSGGEDPGINGAGSLYWRLIDSHISSVSARVMGSTLKNRA